MSEEKHRKTKKQREDEEAQNQDSTSDSSKESEENAMMVALTIDEYDALEKEIEALQAEVDEKTDQWLRTRADFENYKKRVLRDNERHYQDAMTSIIKIFLAVSDDLERALKNKPEAKEMESWINGIALIQQKLINQMKNQGVEQMDVHPGDVFDPNIHEAITQEDHPDLEDGQIIEVLQPGYRISDRIIRPAMVRVAR